MSYISSAPIPHEIPASCSTRIAHRCKKAADLLDSIYLRAAFQSFPCLDLVCGPRVGGVLGKLVATSMDAFYGLVAVFPLLAIPLLLGGLTKGEFWRMLLVLTDTLFLSLSAGIAVSAVSKSSWKAKLGTLLVLVFATS